MEKYPWCAGVDIDLERGGGYENREAANALFQAIYQTVKAYDSSKLVNICLPGMTGVQGSVGGETGAFMLTSTRTVTRPPLCLMAWRGQAAPPARYLPGAGWRESMITRSQPCRRGRFHGPARLRLELADIRHPGEPGRNLPGDFQHLLCRQALDDRRL